MLTQTTSSARGEAEVSSANDRLLRPNSRHPAYWDVGQPGNNMSILLSHAERVLSGTRGVNTILIGDDAKN